MKKSIKKPVKNMQEKVIFRYKTCKKITGEIDEKR
jgi:hypothetical protein